MRSLLANKDEYELQAATFTSQLTGDPSYFEGAEQEEEEPAPEEDEEAEDKQKNQLPDKFREINRLSYIVRVSDICKSCKIISTNIDLFRFIRLDSILENRSRLFHHPSRSAFCRCQENCFL